MRFLKTVSKIIAGLMAFVLIFVLVVFITNKIKTNYLTLDNIDKNNTYLIKNVHVIPMHIDTVLKNKTVYIKNGVIDKISDSIQVQNIRVIEGNQQYLVPGLIDMHVHVWDSYALGLYLANGVTTVRNLWGMPMHLRMKKAINTHKIWGPEFYTTGPKLTGREYIGDDNLNIYSKQEAINAVKRTKEDGYDFVKTYYGLDKDLYDAVIDQAQKSKIDIIAHPSQKVPFNYHLNPQIKSIEHVEEIAQTALNFELDTLKLNKIITDIALAKKHYCPTLVGFYNILKMLKNDAILQNDSLSYMNPLIVKTDSKNQFNRWSQTKKTDTTVTKRIETQHKFQLRIVRELHQAGVPIICGTDAGIGITLPGYSIHDELRFYKNTGMSNYEVLKTATVNAAQTHRQLNNLGIIQKGKNANFLILENNPFENLAALKSPSYVFVKGKKIDFTKLKGFQENAKNSNNLISTALHYLEYLLEKK